VLEINMEQFIKEKPPEEIIETTEEDIA